MNARRQRPQLNDDQLPSAVAALLARCVRDETTGCLIDPTAERYTEARVANARTSGHRAVYRLHHGPIPGDSVVRHDCDRKNCVEVTHLRLGSESQNVRDAWDRGRTLSRALPVGAARPSAVLNDDLVALMRRRVRAGETILDVTSDLGVGYTCARHAIRGNTWKHVSEPPVRQTVRWSRGNDSRKIDTETVAKARALYDGGLSLTEVAAECGISRDTAFVYCSHKRRDVA